MKTKFMGINPSQLLQKNCTLGGTSVFTTTLVLIATREDFLSLPSWTQRRIPTRVASSSSAAMTFLGSPLAKAQGAQALSTSRENQGPGFPSEISRKPPIQAQFRLSFSISEEAQER